MTTLTDKIDALPDARRRNVEERAKTLVKEEMSLRALRRARNMDRHVAKEREIDQENVSPSERRADPLLSTP